MKKIFLLIATFVTANYYCQSISLTGQLTIGGDSTNIGNTSNYIRLQPELAELTTGTGITATRTPIIVVNVSVWKKKSSYTAGKPAIQAYGQRITNEIKNEYIIDAATIATSPSSNLNSLTGHSLYDKQLYWVCQKVLALIIADNPTFTGTIADINL